VLAPAFHGNRLRDLAAVKILTALEWEPLPIRFTLITIMHVLIADQNHQAARNAGAAGGVAYATCD